MALPRILICIFFFCSCTLFAQNNHCKVYSFSSLIELKENKSIQTDTVIFQVNDREGEKYTHVSLPFSKSQKISGLKAWIVDANGNIIRTMNSNEVKEHSAISDYSLFEDDYVKAFQLKHITYPYRFYYTYTSTSRYFHKIEWNPVFKHNMPTSTAKLTLVVNKDFKFQLFNQHIDNPKEEVIADTKCYTWSTSYNEEWKDEIYAAPFFASIPKVVIVPLQFSYGLDGTNTTWQSFGNWQWQLNNNLFDLPESEIQIVKDLVKGITDVREVVKILYHYMQDHTHYVNVTLGVGGWRPYPASYVAKNKYGDCKALSNYMRALLNVVNIPSYYCLVYAGDDIAHYEFDKVNSFFNHAIVMVPLANDTLFLEATNNIAPFAYMGTFTQNRNALLIDEKNSHFVFIPQLTKAQVAVTNNYKVEFSDFGNAEISTRSVVKGDEFELFNHLSINYNKEQQDQYMFKYYAIPNALLNEWGILPHNRDSIFLIITSQQTRNNELKKIGDERYFSLINAKIPSFKSPDVRKMPVIINIPICQIDSMEYTLPVGYQIKSLPNSIHLQSLYGSYQLSFAKLESKVIVTRRFNLNTASYSLAQYPDFFQFIQQIKQADNCKIILKQQ